MYSGYLITPNSRNKILEIFEPEFPDVICHHITYKFPDNEPPPQAHEASIYSYLTDSEGIETLLVKVNGEYTRPDGKLFHITLSIDRNLGYKPKDSNALIANKIKVAKEIDDIEIQIRSELFK